MNTFLLVAVALLYIDSAMESNPHPNKWINFFESIFVTALLWGLVALIALSIDLVVALVKIAWHAR